MFQESTSIFYDDDVKAYESRSLFPGQYHFEHQMPAEACPLPETHFCRGWGVAPDTVNVGNMLRQKPTRLNLPGEAPSTMLYGTSPWMAQGEFHDPEAAGELRYGIGPLRDAQSGRSGLAETDYTGLRHYDLSSCPLPRVEEGLRGGISTRADYRNAQACSQVQ
jgi:hypothetical protein